MKRRKAIIINDTRRERHAGCTAVMDGLERMLDAAGYEIVFRVSVGHEWDTPKFHRHAKPGRLIVVNGEGTIHHSNERAQRLASVAGFAQKKRIKSALVNCTLFENDATLMEELAKFNLIACRDSHSVMVCAAFGIAALQTPDFSFMSGVSVRPQKSDLAPIYFTDSVIKADSAALMSVAENIGGRYLPMKGEPSPKTFMDKLSDSRGIITGRFHAVCLSINAGLPFLAIESNTPKISFLLNDVFRTTNRVKTNKIILEEPKIQSFSMREKFDIIIYKFRGRRQFRRLQKALKQLFPAVHRKR